MACDLTFDQRVKRLKLMRLRAEVESARSLVQYLGNVIVDCEPKPTQWANVWESWQGQIVRPLVPAIESLAGIGHADYAGPRQFWIELPKGHDKTGLIGRLINWLLRFSRVRLSGAAAASTRDQARLLIKSMQAERLLNPWLEKGIEAYRNEFRGPGGAIEVLSSEAGASSGRKDDIVIVDELTFWELQDLWDILYSGSFKRTRQIFIVITNAGIKGTWQWKLREEARTSPLWQFYAAPERQFLAGWMTPSKIEKVRASLRPNFAKRVIDNSWVDATENPLLVWELIQTCVGQCLWPFGQVPRSYAPGSLFMGVDFGRTKNRTVITTLEHKANEYLIRDVDVLHNVDFHTQEQRIEEKIRRYGNKLKKVKCDKGAQGWTTTENLERKYPRIVEGVFLSGNYPAVIALALHALFSSQKITVPNISEMHVDLQRVSEVNTANGKPKVNTEEGQDGLHADYFWSLALGVDCCPDAPRNNIGIPTGYR